MSGQHLSMERARRRGGRDHMSPRHARTASSPCQIFGLFQETLSIRFECELWIREMCWRAVRRSDGVPRRWGKAPQGGGPDAGGKPLGASRERDPGSAEGRSGGGACAPGPVHRGSGQGVRRGRSLALQLTRWPAAASGPFASQPTAPADADSPPRRPALATPGCRRSPWRGAGRPLPSLLGLGWSLLMKRPLIES